MILDKLTNSGNDKERAISQIQRKQSYLCVGLDTDIQKIPGHLLHEDDPVFIFNKAIIDATIDYAVAYKPNLAFYESLGPKGLESLQKTIEYLPDDVFTIADAKRGDIGNTSGLYARAFFEYYQFRLRNCGAIYGVRFSYALLKLSWKMGHPACINFE